MEKNRGFSRRDFLAAGATSGAVMLTGGFASVLRTPTLAAAGVPVLEAGIARLQAAMASGQLTSRALVLAYLERIASLNPTLHAVIETNPDAVAIAARLDAERRSGKPRGPLHGIPILLKDNIATNDAMQTTAGSLAIYGNRVPADAVIVSRLRAAGAVILGKANLGEWANFRGSAAPDPELGWVAVGWSARGGNAINPYVLSYTPWGSSSGSGIGVAANLCAAAVGTETDGSITGPSNANLVVGLKPTLGLVSQRGIIPISSEQDTAGPMARSVTDVAILLGAMQSPFGRVEGHAVPGDYTRFLRRGALRGARIGADQRYFDDYDSYGNPGDGDAVPLVHEALDAMVALGATIVPTDTGDIFDYFGYEFEALLCEFKAQIAEYLSTLTQTTMRTLADLIAFNTAHCPAEFACYGQEIFEAAEATSGDLSDPAYAALRTYAIQAARGGLDGALDRDGLDAIVAPHLTNSTAAAVAGYPNISIPVGVRDSGKPVGMMMYGSFLHEPQLIAFAYDLEQELNARVPPRFIGSVAPVADPGLCTALPKKPHVFTGRAHLPRGRIF